jgi:hypothetical protein
LFDKRVTLLVGHFGSGKTEIALNGALGLAAEGTGVTLVDLDVVKPYFRSRSGRQFLAEAGVAFVAPTGENIHADLPIIVPEIRNVLTRGDGKVLMDVGGDDTGARVLGSLSDVIPSDQTDCLLVLNFRRPFTRNPGEAVSMAREIEAVSRMKVGGIVSNTHLMGETTPEVVLEGYRMAVETGEQLGVPVTAVAVDGPTRDLLDPGAVPCDLFVMTRIIRPPFEQGPSPRSSGPLFVLN